MNHCEMEITFARNSGCDGMLDRVAIAYEIRHGVVMIYGVLKCINFQATCILRKHGFTIE